MSKINRALYAYLWFFLVYTLCGRIVPVSVWLEGPINSIIFILFALFGSLLVGYDLLKTRYIFKAKYISLLAVFLGVMGISTILNRDLGMGDNIKTMVWTAIQFFLLYPLFIRNEHYQKQQFIRLICKTFIAIWGVAILISLYQYVFQIGYETLCEGRMLRQGFVDQRLFGIFKDPNFAASTSLICMIATACLLYTTKHNGFKVFYLFNILIQFIYLVLSGSRSVLVAYIAAMIILFFLTIRRFALIHYDFADRLFYSLTSIIIAIFLSLGSYYGVKSICEAIPEIIGTATEDSTLDREDVNEENISNNRFDIWKDYVSHTLEKDHILFGLSPRNNTLHMQEYEANSYVGKTGYETHNAYVSLFSGVGIVGSVVMGIFIFLSIRNIWNIVFVTKNYNIWFVLALSIVGGLACYSFFLTDLFFVNNLTTIVFWPLLGYLNTNVGNDSAKK